MTESVTHEHLAVKIDALASKLDDHIESEEGDLVRISAKIDSIDSVLHGTGTDSLGLKGTVARLSWMVQIATWFLGIITAAILVEIVRQFTERVDKP